MLYTDSTAWVQFVYHSKGILDAFINIGVAVSAEDVVVEVATSDIEVDVTEGAFDLFMPKF